MPGRSTHLPIQVGIGYKHVYEGQMETWNPPIHYAGTYRCTYSRLNKGPGELHIDKLHIVEGKVSRAARVEAEESYSSPMLWVKVIEDTGPAIQTVKFSKCMPVGKVDSLKPDPFFDLILGQVLTQLLAIASIYKASTHSCAPNQWVSHLTDKENRLSMLKEASMRFQKRRKKNKRMKE